MTTPVRTPNRATTTRPERSSRRVTHKAPLAWLPWVAGALLALLLLAVIGILVAAKDDAGSSGAAAGLSSSALDAVSSRALIGGAGSRPGAQSSAPGHRDPGTAGTVLFEENSAGVDAAGRQVVSAAAAALRAAGAKKVEVAGFTDVVAGTPVNVPLSQARADAVAALLRQQLPGVAITTTGRGEHDPVASNATPAGRQQNRRAAILARG